MSRSQLKNQALVMVRETIYPFTKEVEELKVAQSMGIYRKLNIPVSMVIYSL